MIPNSARLLLAAFPFFLHMHSAGRIFLPAGRRQVSLHYTHTPQKSPTGEIIIVVIKIVLAIVIIVLTEKVVPIASLTMTTAVSIIAIVAVLLTIIATSMYGIVEFVHLLTVSLLRQSVRFVSLLGIPRSL